MLGCAECSRVWESPSSYEITEVLLGKLSHAEAEAVEAAMRAFTEELEAEARDIFKSNERSDIVAYKLYDLVVGRSQSVQRMFGEREAE